MVVGQKVKASHIVFTTYYQVEGEVIYSPREYIGHKKCLVRRKQNIEGIYLGFSFLHIGTGVSDEYYHTLSYRNYHRVACIQPLDKSGRYLKPVKCLFEDIKEVQNNITEVA